MADRSPRRAGARAAAWGLALALTLVGAGCQRDTDDGPADAPESPRIAVADAGVVRVRDADGAFTTVAAVPAGWRAESLTWSADGTHLAWLASSGDQAKTRVYRAPAAGGAVRQWDCELLCGTVAFLGADLVSDGDVLGSLYRYPASGGRPESFRPDGLPSGGGLGAISPPVSIVASTGRADGLFVSTTSELDGAERIYRLDATGATATEVHDVGSAASALNGVVSRDGRSLAYTIERAGTDCPKTHTVVLVDLRSGQPTKITAPPSGPSGSDRPWYASALWFDAGGELSVAYVAGSVPCARAAASPEPTAPTTPAAARVHRREDTRWVATDARAREGADLGGGRTALLTGPLTVGPAGVHLSPPGTLTLTGSGDDSGKDSGDDQVIATGVTDFAVAPTGG